MASLTQWTRVWASSRSWWWTGNPGVLQSLGLQRVRQDWATELSGRHSLIKVLQGWKWSESVSHSVVSNSLLHSPWNSPGQNTGVGSHSLLQGIFPTQGSNPGLPHCRYPPASLPAGPQGMPCSKLLSSKRKQWLVTPEVCFTCFWTLRKQTHTIGVLLGLSIAHQGEGNGKPLQYSCLENPMDGGCIPWGHYKLVAIEWLHFHFSLSCNGEGNGNPLQCSCLENPRDGRAWWAVVYGVAQSRTQLKRLSSSSSSIAHQDPLFMGFSKEEYWSGLPFSSAEDLSDPGIEPVSPEAPALWADSLLLNHQGSLTLSFFYATSFCPIFS